MREIDRIAVEETGPSLLQMMENAGRSLAVQAIANLTAPVNARRVLVMSGTGGNGGGGICAARHLMGRVGQVDLCVVGAQLSSAAEAQRGIYRAAMGSEVPFDGLVHLAPYDLVIDAVIGYGLRDAPAGLAARAIAWMNSVSSFVLSLDLPSGVDADGGAAPGSSVRAHATLTLHLPKPGLVGPGAGALSLADLGIPAAVTSRVGASPPSYGEGFVTPLLRAIR